MPSDTKLGEAKGLPSPWRTGDTALRMGSGACRPCLYPGPAPDPLALGPFKNKPLVLAESSGSCSPIPVPTGTCTSDRESGHDGSQGA